MFTGIVEDRGIVNSLRSERAAIRLQLEVPETFAQDGCRIGDSIAINGCCLTVVEAEERLWSFQAGEETLSKTNLGELSAGDFVNLERSLRMDGRIDGHFVQGHVDGVGHVESVAEDGEWTTIWFRVPERLIPELVPKGSVAVDGVSLTVVEVDEDKFSVALIPHTLQITTLGILQPGSAVNIETDVLGKYIHRLLELRGIK